MTLCMVPPLDLQAKCFLFIPVTLVSAYLEVLVPRGSMLPVGDTTAISLNWKLRLPPTHFVFLMPLNQQAEKGLLYWLSC
jgi:hypothetical protein